VIDATTGHVIALHFAGLYLDANFGVPTSELARDGRIIDTGINFVPGAQAEHGVSRTNAARNRVAGHPGALPHAGFLPAQTARAPDCWLGSSLQAAAARTRAPKPQRRSPEATTTTSRLVLSFRV
jgi:hypothetical protein